MTDEECDFDLLVERLGVRGESRILTSLLAA